MMVPKGIWRARMLSEIASASVSEAKTDSTVVRHNTPMPSCPKARIPFRPSGPKLGFALDDLLTEQPRHEICKVIPPISPHVPFFRFNELVINMALVQQLTEALDGW